MVKSKRRIINFDETWVGQLNFRRKVWQSKGRPASAVVKHVTPRISLIAAIDNYGEVYLCFTQTNTDSKIMALYIREFVKVLDKENRDWREETVILHDGAKYASCASTQAALQELRVPFMLLSPYSYNVAPCELLFGATKVGDLNPGRLPTGKRYVRI